MAVPLPKGADFGRTKRTRRTLVLAAVFVLYLILGGVAFRYLETYSKLVKVQHLTEAWSPIADHFKTHENKTQYSESNWTDFKQVALESCEPNVSREVGSVLESARRSSDATAAKAGLQQALELCGPGARQIVEEERQMSWSFIDSVFFCMTVVTTIGYGHISPKSPGGQIFCIVYSLIGIPISGLLLAGLSDFFAGNLLNFYDSKWQKQFGHSRWSLAAFTVIYLLVGFLLFVFVPAVIFTWLEDWNYRQAVYYAFITLSTIGFGDFTAAIANDDAWTSVYKVFVMVWVLVGLGYWVLVLNFLQKTIKSKEVVATLKSTSRLIAREAEDLRNVLSEAGIIHRDAQFIPEHSKTALSLMLGMSSTLAGTSQPDSPDSNGPSAVRGIHNIGNNLRSNSLLAALMASLPTDAAVDTPMTTSSATAEDASGGGSANGGTVVDVELTPQDSGEINAGYVPDGSPERTLAG